jgi:hypothetical protein
MSKTVSKDIGNGVVASVEVPVGSDQFDIPRDMERLAEGLLTAIQAKSVSAPGGGTVSGTQTMTWREHLSVSDDLVLKSSTTQLITPPVVTPAHLRQKQCFVLLRTLIQVKASGVQDEGAVKMHYVRIGEDGKYDDSGFNAFVVRNSTEHWFAHTWLWDNTSATNSWAAQFAVKARCSANGQYTLTARQFDVFLIERHPHDTSARALLAADGLPTDDLVVGQPNYYSVVDKATGAVTFRLTDLAWLNGQARIYPGTVSAGIAGDVVAALGDGTHAKWNGTAWVLLP